MKNLFRRLSRKLRLGGGTGTEPPPVVVNTFATGVKLGGRLLRKQEVELNMPSSSSSYH